MSNTFVLSDSNRTNAHGFRIDLRGLDLERFRQNPVMLTGHNHENVIGKWDNIRIEGGRLLADADFDEDDEQARRLAKKVEKGYLKGASLGIIIRSLKEDDDGTMLAVTSEAIEASIVAVPSDAGAVHLYDDAHNVVELSALQAHFNAISNPKKMDKNNEQLMAQVTELTAQLATAQQRVAELEKQAAIEHEAKIERLLAAAVAEKKIGADEKVHFAALAKVDFGSVEKILAARQSAIRVAAKLTATATGKTGHTWDELDRAGKLFALKKDNPEEYERLYNEKFGDL